MKDIIWLIGLIAWAGVMYSSVPDDSKALRGLPVDVGEYDVDEVAMKICELDEGEVVSLVRERADERGERAPRGFDRLVLTRALVCVSARAGAVRDAELEEALVVLFDQEPSVAMKERMVSSWGALSLAPATRQRLTSRVIHASEQLGDSFALIELREQIAGPMAGRWSGVIPPGVEPERLAWCEYVAPMLLERVRPLTERQEMELRSFGHRELVHSLIVNDCDGARAEVVEAILLDEAKVVEIDDATIAAARALGVPRERERSSFFLSPAVSKGVLERLGEAPTEGRADEEAYRELFSRRSDGLTHYIDSLVWLSWYRPDGAAKFFDALFGKRLSCVSVESLLVRRGGGRVAAPLLGEFGEKIALRSKLEPYRVHCPQVFENLRDGAWVGEARAAELRRFLEGAPTEQVSPGSGQ